MSGSSGRIVARYGTIIGLVGLVAVFSVMKPSTFPTWSNALTIFTQGSLLGIVAAGLTVCLILGEFDLSIGYSVTLGGIVAALVVNAGAPVGVAVIAAVGSGLLVGLVNGVVVAYVRVNAFIGTLGTGAVVFGIALALTNNGEAQLVSDPAFINIGQGTVATVPVPVLISIAATGLLWLFVNKTELGRRVDAVGGNAAAARLSGIRVSRIRLIGFLISGTAAAAAGAVLCAQLGSVYSTSGDTFLLQAFTACFLGAVTLRDGEFHVLGTVVGVLIMAVTFNGLAQLGVAAFWTNVAQGAILVGAVAISALSGRVLLRWPSRRARTPAPRVPALGE